MPTRQPLQRVSPGLSGAHLDAIVGATANFELTRSDLFLRREKALRFWSRSLSLDHLGKRHRHSPIACILAMHSQDFTIVVAQKLEIWAYQLIQDDRETKFREFSQRSSF
jgi:hypothetical protein